MSKKTKVAFICVHNSCRSQIAEALGRHLAGDVLECYSAGGSDEEFKAVIQKIEAKVLELGERNRRSV